MCNEGQNNGTSDHSYSAGMCIRHMTVSGNCAIRIQPSVALSSTPKHLIDQSGRRTDYPMLGMTKKSLNKSYICKVPVKRKVREKLTWT